MKSKIIFIIFCFIHLSACCPGQLSIFSHYAVDENYFNQNIFSLITIEALRPLDAQTDYLKKIAQKRRMKKSSREAYLKNIKNFLIWIQKNHISEPTYENIVDYKKYLENEKILSTFTVSNYLYAVKITFAELESLNLYPNIAKKLLMPKIKSKIRKKTLTNKQAMQLLRAIDRATISGKRDFAMINLLLHTGLRTLEIADAKIENIIEVEGQVVLLVKNKKKETLVVLIDSVINPIKEYIQSRGISTNRGPLFASHSRKNFGQKITTRTVSRIVKNALLSIGLDDSKLTTHSLRDTAIKFSLLGGATLEEASMLARYSNLGSMAKHITPSDRIKNAAESKIADFLSKENQ